MLLILKVPGLLWRWRRALIAAALIAPLAITGSLEMLAVNAAALGLAAIAVLRSIGGR